jgi:hypothetical protein
MNILNWFHQHPKPCKMCISDVKSLVISLVLWEEVDTEEEGSVNLPNTIPETHEIYSQAFSGPRSVSTINSALLYEAKLKHYIPSSKLLDMATRPAGTGTKMAVLARARGNLADRLISSRILCTTAEIMRHVVSPAWLGTKNQCLCEGQQQFTRPIERPTITFRD